MPRKIKGKRIQEIIPLEAGGVIVDCYTLHISSTQLRALKAQRKKDKITGEIWYLLNLYNS